jgi:O-antigen/teichoic acid export membrane protein
MRGVFKHALIFGMAPLLRKLVGLIVVPLYTHYLSTRDYGEIELLSMATGLLGLVLSLEMRAGYLRMWAAVPNGRAGLLAGTTCLLAALGAFGAVLLLVTAEPLSDALLGRWIGWGYATVLALGLFADILSLVFNATLQAALRSTLMVTLSVAQFAVSLSITAFCVMYLRTGPIGVFLGGAVASILALLVMARVCIAESGWAAPHRETMAALVRFSLPLLLAALMFFVVGNADRFIVSRFLSVGDLGLYAMAWTLAGLVTTLIFKPVQTSLDVWRYTMHDLPDGAGQFANTFRVVMALMGLAAVGLATLGCDAFTRVVDPAFVPAVAYVPWLCGAVVLQAGYSIVASAFFIKDATSRWTRLFAISAAVQVASSLALVPFAGLIGAALAMLVANLFLYAGAAVQGQQLWRVPYPHAATLTMTILVVALPGLRNRLALPNLTSAMLADIATLGLFLLALFMLRMVRMTDVATLPGLLFTRHRDHGFAKGQTL